MPQLRRTPFFYHHSSDLVNLFRSGMHTCLQKLFHFVGHLVTKCMWIAVIINIPSLSHIKIKEKIRFCFSINEPLMKRRGKNWSSAHARYSRHLQYSKSTKVKSEIRSKISSS